MQRRLFAVTKSLSRRARDESEERNQKTMTVSNPTRSQLILCMATVCLLIVPQVVSATSDAGAVYVMTNRAGGNSVLVYNRASDGSLTRIQEAATKGLGTGVTQDPFMSAGSLRLREDGKLLFAVNAASGELTAFVVTSSGLQFGSKVLSGGLFPVSVTVRGNLVYVLNQLGAANISGFTVTDAGQLQPIPNSTRELAGGGLALPAQVSFTPDGSQLLVTEKGTDLIDIFEVQADGTTSGPTTKLSAGHTPFGFAFTSNNGVVISEAERRFPHKGTTSSYSLGGTDGLTTVSGAVPDGQTAACWVAITGQTAWIVNTLTSNISSYTVGSDNSLILAKGIAASTGDLTTPIDVAPTPDGAYIYVVKSAVGAIGIFRTNGSSLTPLPSVNGLPLSIAGIAVR
jgi:DNA-binding beta-propeller fold protein YncE